MINNRSNDTKVEREIACYLDNHLYNDSQKFTEAIRTDNVDEQVRGSDILLSTCDGELNRSVVDEKVASRYANKRMETFALEISFIGRNKKKMDGWFIDKTKTTEWYLFGWIPKADIPYIEEDGRYDTDKIDRNNIRKFEYVLINRQKIIDFLEEKGWTLDKIKRQEEKIRENGFVKTKAFIDDVSFRYSDSYIEKPVNILLKKKTYIKLCKEHEFIK